jgi:hypothetical protein
MALSCTHAIGCRSRRGNAREPGLGVEEAGESRPDRGMVVDHRDSD